MMLGDRDAHQHLTLCGAAEIPLALLVGAEMLDNLNRADDAIEYYLRSVRAGFGHFLNGDDRLDRAELLPAVLLRDCQTQIAQLRCTGDHRRWERFAFIPVGCLWLELVLREGTGLFSQLLLLVGQTKVHFPSNCADST